MKKGTSTQIQATIKAGRKLIEVDAKGHSVGYHTFERDTKANFAFTGHRNVLEVGGKFYIRTI